MYAASALIEVAVELVGTASVIAWMGPRKSLVPLPTSGRFGSNVAWHVLAIPSDTPMSTTAPAALVGAGSVGRVQVVPAAPVPGCIHAALSRPGVLFSRWSGP